MAALGHAGPPSPTQTQSPLLAPAALALTLPLVSALAKYRQIFLTGIQTSLVYRWNFAVRASFSLLHLVYVFVLWGAAYAGRDTIGGFSLGATLTYFTVLLVLQFLLGAQNDDYEISEEIRGGQINQFLTKPVNYFGYRLSLYFSARLVSGGLALLPVLAALPLLWPKLSFPGAEHAALYALVPLALVLSALVQFTIAYCFGMLTFWFLEIQSFVILSLAIEAVLGGQIFPLDLLPGWLYSASAWLPYYYQMYFPAALLTGRITELDTALRGLAIQATWVLLLLGLASLLWRRGLRRDTAVGG
jgi:ABC-2 type transport system permease protein